MSTSTLYTALLYLLLLFSCFDFSMARRLIPSSAPSTMVRPLLAGDPDYVTMKPQGNHKQQQVFHGKAVKGCLPKGFKRASAPSRFVNSHTLGSGCFSSLHPKKKP